MTVRPLTASDGPAWHAMMRVGTADHPAAFLLSYREVCALSDTQVADRMASGHLHGLFDGAALTGFAGLHLSRLDRLRHRASIGPFFVAADARGTGAADRLMFALAGVALAQDVGWLDLWVAASNARARAFYARHRFAEVARREDAVRLDGGPEDDILMTCRLTRPEAI